MKTAIKSLYLTQLNIMPILLQTKDSNNLNLLITKESISSTSVATSETFLKAIVISTDSSFMENSKYYTNKDSLFCTY